jgi:hypothetical protein
MKKHQRGRCLQAIVQNHVAKKLLLLALMAIPLCTFAGGGIAAGLDGAAGEVKGIFSNTSNLILAIGGIVGLIGGIRVYIKWNNGDQDVQKELIGWAGACIFLLMSGVVIKTFFDM